VDTPVTANPVQDDLLARLAAAGKDEEPFAVFVAYACDGDEALAGAVSGETAVERRAPSRTRKAADRAVVPRAYLKHIKVRAFRGIGPERTLVLPEGRGLTIVSGRNGCGKSSFAEALELLLTDQCSRFSAAIAAEGWRNHHVDENPFIAADVLMESTGLVTFSRRWGKDASLKDGETVVKDGASTVALATTPWLRASRDYRPFLAYSQLGEMLDGKSALYDALMTGLGLERYVEVRSRLMNAAREIDKRQDEAKAAAVKLAGAARAAREAAEDARLEEVATLLAAKTWDLDALQRLVADDLEDDGRGQLLRQLATLRPPDAGSAAEAVTGLRSAIERARQVGKRSAGRARQVADLLERALDVTKVTGTAACPVCGTDDVIDAEWRSRTTEAVGRLRSDATEADEAQRDLEKSRTRVMQLCASPPAVLAAAVRADLDVAAVHERWTAFAAAPADAADPAALAQHVEERLPALTTAVAAAVAMAQTELARREDVWRPVALQLAAWLPGARQAEAGRDAKRHLRKAEDWLKDVIEDIRRERFEPIAQQAARYWSLLRLQSGVELRDVQMVGSGPRRGVQLDVSVEGTDTSALSVMSQGELNSLALSLFLPRATMQESPFGFVIIDDPVQALDPAKVEGLARVLAEAAATHQVVVFTHDDRLPEAVRRLEIRATFVDIMRKDRSAVEIRRVKGPVSMLLDDARAIAKTEAMPDAIKLRLVPNFCRSAVEAACHEVVRARRLLRGDAHADVEDLLVKAGRLRNLLALALFDDVEKGGDVETRLGSERKAAHKQTFRACLEGAHGDFTGDPAALVTSSEALVEFIRAKAAKV
jgi:energy-coupling factor transporter ATP-binding protein EcfA2